MPVVLMAKVTSRQEGSDSLTSGQYRKLHAALKKDLETIAGNTTADIAATFMQENVTSLTYLCMMVAQSHPGVDTKLAMKPFLRYLDTDDVLKLDVGKLGFAAALTTKARLWVEMDGNSGIFRACCLEQKPDSLVLVFTNKDAINSGNIGYGIYQPMSRLMYCKQLELDQSEQFIYTDTSIVNVNVTQPMIAISDYYPVSQSRVRICADMYVPKASGKWKKSLGALCASSVELILSAIVACMIVSK